MMEEGKLVFKEWGEEEYITNNDWYCSKWLYVQPLCACSEHCHRRKIETFHVIAGTGAIAVAGKIQAVTMGDTVHIPEGLFHYFATATGMTLLEISTHHSDEDVVRRVLSHRLSSKNDAELWRALGLG